jgi:predicted helicase
LNVNINIKMLRKFKEFIVAKNIKTFRQFEISARLCERKEKGDLFEALCFWFLKLNTLTHYDNVWHYSSCPINIKEKLKLPVNDRGIDFVLQKDADYFAVQSKFRYSQFGRVKLTWEETSTFAGLTFGSAEGFKRGILMTNANDVPNEFKNNKYFIYDGLYLDRHLAPIFPLIINSALGTENKIVPRKLFSYQIRIFRDSVSHFANSRSARTDGGILEIACGCGKTFLAYAIVTKLRAERVIFLVPSLFLLSQTFAEWIREDRARNIERKYLLIGSDLDSNMKEFSSYYDITTSADNITKFLKTGKNQVIISTYQSSLILLEELNKSLWGSDFLIFDEAHKTCGQVGKVFSAMLEYKYPMMKKLFLTATPSFYEGINENIVSMKNTNIYGRVISKFNIGQAIRANALTDYQVVVSATPNNQIEKIIRDKKWVFDEEIGKNKSDQIHKAIIIGKTIKRLKCTHILTYHRDIKSTILFQNLLKTIFRDEFPILQIDGLCSMKKRAAIIEKFSKSKSAILCSSQVMNEGVNIPQIDAVCFVDPRNSVRDIIQCIGRCLRKHEGKKKSYVIIPEILKNDDVEDSQFRDIWTVLRALKSQDEEIKDYITDRINEKETKTKLRIINPFVGQEIDQLVDEQIDIKDWEKKIMLKIYHIADQWEITYLKLKKYIEENEKYPTQSSKNVEIKKLGLWINNQRTIKRGKRSGVLNPEKIAKLESLKNWVWDVDLDSWDEIFDKVKKYIGENEKYPTQSSKDVEIKKLGNWINTQRAIKRGKKSGVLTPEKIAKLESLKNWVWDVDLDSWDEIFDKVKKYIGENEKYPTTSNKDVEIKKLGKWIINQRTIKRGTKRGILTPEKIAKLESLKNWKWNCR